MLRIRPRVVLLCLLAAASRCSWCAIPDGGIVHLRIDGDQTLIGIPRSLYAHSRVTIHLDCHSNQSRKLTAKWIMRQTDCVEPDVDRADVWLQLFSTTPRNDDNPTQSASTKKRSPMRLLRGRSTDGSSCEAPSNAIAMEKSEKWSVCTWLPGESYRFVDCALPETMPPPPNETLSAENRTLQADSHPSSTEKAIMQVPVDGVYLLLLRIFTSANVENDYRLEVTVKMQTPFGYLSAADWPLINFYTAMCGVYLSFGVLWLVLCARQCHDLIQVQLWIGAVIFIGMLEKALFYAEFQATNRTGYPITLAVCAAELCSSFKKAVSRMLIIVVALGFGITKPRLGENFYKVLGAGSVFFLLSAVEAGTRLMQVRERGPHASTVFAVVPLTLVDTAIWWWVFTALVGTIRTLRLRRNATKLRLYQRLVNVLALAVVAALAFMAWSVWDHQVSARCNFHWRRLWFDEAFWHVLFSAVLAGIMLLFRPTGNNARYAFSTHVMDDEDGEMLAGERDVGSGDTETLIAMKPLHGKKQKKTKQSRKSDDFRWTGEALPSKVADALLDSEDEFLERHLQLSKME